MRVPRLYGNKADVYVYEKITIQCNRVSALGKRRRNAVARAELPMNGAAICTGASTLTCGPALSLLDALVLSFRPYWQTWVRT